MKSRTLFLFFLVLTFSVAGAVHAECPLTLSIEEVRALALKNSPIAAEIDQEYSNELAKAFATAVLNNPELQAEYVMTSAHLAGDNDPQSSVSIGQPLRLSDFGTRDRVSALIKKAGSSQQRVKLLEFNQQLTFKYSKLLMLQQSVELLHDAERRAELRIKLIRQGVSKGLMSLGDANLFEGERFRVQAQIQGMNAAIALMHYEIGKLIGSPRCFSVSAVTPFVPLPSTDELQARAKRSEISEVSRIDALSSLAAEQVRLAEYDAFPELTPQAVYQHTNDGGDFWGVGLTMPLPVWNRNQAEITKATAEQAVIKRKRELLANGGLEEQIRLLRISAESFEKQHELYSKKVVTSFEAALRSQEKLYNEGNGDIIQVWQTFRTLNEVQVQALNLWLEVLEARIKLSILIGEEI